MGSPMAVHLAKAGHQVVGCERSPQRAAALVEAGGSAADSIAQAVAGADVVAVMVPDSPDVQAVLAGENGVFDNAPAGALIIDFSSIRPDVTTALAAQAAERGFRIIDAPVSGGEAGAVNAALSIMVGGTPEDFESAKPILDVVGKNIQLLAEASIFLEAYGVGTKAAVEVLGGGLAGSAVLNQKAQKMLDRSFEPGFRIDLHHKDLGILTTAARAAGVVAPLGAVVAELMASARANGDGGLDHSALLRGVERLSGHGSQ